MKNTNRENIPKTITNNINNYFMICLIDFFINE